MEPTRVDNKKLKAAVSSAARKVEEAIDALRGVLVLLPEHERASLLRVRTDFPRAARLLAQQSDAHRELVALTEYDAAAVLEDLDNVEALGPLDGPLARLQQMRDDSRLLWLAEAAVATLELYGVAKVRARKDGNLAQTIAPLAGVLASPRRTTPTAEPAAPEE